MLHFRVLLYFFVTLLALAACRNEGTDSADSHYQKYYDSVMLVHDRAMELMGSINQLSEELKEKRMVALDQNQAQLLKINDLLGRLNRAEDAMFDWMNKFDPDPVSGEDRLRYIQLELYHIKQTEMLMVGTIGEVEDFLGRNQ